MAMVSREEAESVYMAERRWLAVRIQMAIVRASSSGV